MNGFRTCILFFYNNYHSYFADVKSLLIPIGFDTFAIDLHILLDRWGFIVTGHALLHGDHRPIGFEHRDPLLLETSAPGIFAAGDVRDTSTKQVVSAAGEGSSAALEIREYLKLN